jgi:hypothetical protein
MTGASGHREAAVVSNNKPGLIRGVVLTAGGRPVAGARVFFRSGPGSLPDIAALTTYEGAAAADDAEPVSTTVVLTSGETAAVTLRLHT